MSDTSAYSAAPPATDVVTSIADFMLRVPETQRAASIITAEGAEQAMADVHAGRDVDLARCLTDKAKLRHAMRAILARVQWRQMRSARPARSPRSRRRRAPGGRSGCRRVAASRDGPDEPDEPPAAPDELAEPCSLRSTIARGAR